MKEFDLSCKDEKKAKQLAALAHPARLKIVRHLSKENACCVKSLVGRVDLAQSTVSQHLKTLLNAGLVTYQTRQQSSWYEINQDEFTQLADSLNIMFSECCSCHGEAKMPDQDEKKVWTDPRE